jgi:hypothetical protein
MMRQFVGFLSSIVMESFLWLVTLAGVPKGNIRWDGGSSRIADFATANVRFAKAIH